MSFAALSFDFLTIWHVRLRFCRKMVGMNTAFHSLSPTEPNGLDAFDRRILARYQHDTRTPAQTIGDEVGLSAATVQRRIKRLHETGVITADIAQIAPAAVGLPVTVVVHVDIERETLAHIDAFKTAMRSCPSVQQCWYTTGLTDFILVVRLPSLAAYEHFTRDVLMSHKNVAKFTSFVVLGEVKSGLSLTI